MDNSLELGLTAEDEIVIDFLLGHESDIETLDSIRNGDGVDSVVMLRARFLSIGGWTPAEIVEEAMFTGG